MSRSELIEHIVTYERRAEHSLAWAGAVTVLFAAVAAISFAVDLTVSLASL